jgi:hypothetical protein
MSINAIIFGSSGMIGQAVLLECLDNSEVNSVLLVNRKPSGIRHSKVKDIIHENFYDISGLIPEFLKYDTCFFSLGVSAVGMQEADYHKITYDLTVGVAETLLKTGKDFTFCYISGAGTDRTEKGRMMWARVKGKLENKLLSMPFRHVYMFRPGYIQPMRGIKSRTAWYNAVYVIFKPLYYVLRPFPKLLTDTNALSKAMVNVALKGYEKNILENEDINKVGRISA